MYIIKMLNGGFLGADYFGEPSVVAYAHFAWTFFTEEDAHAFAAWHEISGYELVERDYQA